MQIIVLMFLMIFQRFLSSFDRSLTYMMWLGPFLSDAQSLQSRGPLLSGEPKMITQCCCDIPSFLFVLWQGVWQVQPVFCHGPHQPLVVLGVPAVCHFLSYSCIPDPYCLLVIPSVFKSAFVISPVQDLLLICPGRLSVSISEFFRMSVSVPSLFISRFFRVPFLLSFISVTLVWPKV